MLSIDQYLIPTSLSSPASPCRLCADLLSDCLSPRKDTCTHPPCPGRLTLGANGVRCVHGGRKKKQRARKKRETIGEVLAGGM